MVEFASRMTPDEWVCLQRGDRVKVEPGHRLAGEEFEVLAIDADGRGLLVLATKKGVLESTILNASHLRVVSMKNPPGEYVPLGWWANIREGDRHRLINGTWETAQYPFIGAGKSKYISTKEGLRPLESCQYPITPEQAAGLRCGDTATVLRPPTENPQAILKAGDIIHVAYVRGAQVFYWVGAGRGLASYPIPCDHLLPEPRDPELLDAEAVASLRFGDLLEVISPPLSAGCWHRHRPLRVGDVLSFSGVKVGDVITYSGVGFTSPLMGTLIHYDSHAGEEIHFSSPAGDLSGTCVVEASCLRIVKKTEDLPVTVSAPVAPIIPMTPEQWFCLRENDRVVLLVDDNFYRAGTIFEVRGIEADGFGRRVRMYRFAMKGESGYSTAAISPEKLGVVSMQECPDQYPHAWWVHLKEGDNVVVGAGTRLSVVCTFITPGIPFSPDQAERLWVRAGSGNYPVDRLTPLPTSSIPPSEKSLLATGAGAIELPVVSPDQPPPAQPPQEQQGTAESGAIPELVCQTEPGTTKPVTQQPGSTEPMSLAQWVCLGYWDEVVLLRDHKKYRAGSILGVNKIWAGLDGKKVELLNGESIDSSILGVRIMKSPPGDQEPALLWVARLQRGDKIRISRDFCELKAGTVHEVVYGLFSSSVGFMVSTTDGLCPVDVVAPYKEEETPSEDAPTLETARCQDALEPGLTEDQVANLWCGDKVRVLSSNKESGTRDAMAGFILEYAFSSHGFLYYWHSSLGKGILGAINPNYVCLIPDSRQGLSRALFYSLGEGDLVEVCIQPSEHYSNYSNSTMRVGDCFTVAGTAFKNSVPTVRLQGGGYIASNCLRLLRRSGLNATAGLNRPISRDEWAVLSPGDELKALPGAVDFQGNEVSGLFTVQAVFMSGDSSLLVSDGTRTCHSRHLAPVAIQALQTAHQPVAPGSLTPAQWVDLVTDETVKLIMYFRGYQKGTVFTVEGIEQTSTPKKYVRVYHKDHPGGPDVFRVPIDYLAKYSQDSPPRREAVPKYQTLSYGAADLQVASKNIRGSSIANFIEFIAPILLLGSLFTLVLLCILPLVLPALQKNSTPISALDLIGFVAKQDRAERTKRSVAREYEASRRGQPNRLSDAILEYGTARREATSTRDQFREALRNQSGRDPQVAERILHRIEILGTSPGAVHD